MEFKNKLSLSQKHSANKHSICFPVCFRFKDKDEWHFSKTYEKMLRRQKAPRGENYRCFYCLYYKCNNHGLLITDQLLYLSQLINHRPLCILLRLWVLAVVLLTRVRLIPVLIVVLHRQCRRWAGAVSRAPSAWRPGAAGGPDPLLSQRTTDSLPWLQKCELELASDFIVINPNSCDFLVL